MIPTDHKRRDVYYGSRGDEQYELMVIDVVEGEEKCCECHGQCQITYGVYARLESWPCQAKHGVYGEDREVGVPHPRHCDVENVWR